MFGNTTEIKQLKRDIKELSRRLRDVEVQQIYRVYPPCAGLYESPEAVPLGEIMKQILNHLGLVVERTPTIHSKTILKPILEKHDPYNQCKH